MRTGGDEDTGVVVPKSQFLGRLPDPSKPVFLPGPLFPCPYPYPYSVLVGGGLQGSTPNSDAFGQGVNCPSTYPCTGTGDAHLHGYERRAPARVRETCTCTGTWTTVRGEGNSWSG
jgi:hypothetical protein